MKPLLKRTRYKLRFFAVAFLCLPLNAISKTIDAGTQSISPSTLQANDRNEQYACVPIAIGLAFSYLHTPFTYEKILEACRVDDSGRANIKVIAEFADQNGLYFRALSNVSVDTFRESLCNEECCAILVSGDPSDAHAVFLGRTEGNAIGSSDLIRLRGPLSDNDLERYLSRKDSVAFILSKSPQPLSRVDSTLATFSARSILLLVSVLVAVGAFRILRRSRRN